MFALAVFISSLMQTRWLTIVLFSWATIVAASRIFIGVHYPADVIAGAFVGVFSAFLVLYLFRFYLKKKKKFELVNDLNC